MLSIYWGIYLRRRKFLVEKVSLKILGPGVVITFLIVLFTYKLNTGPFNFSVYDAVVIIFASHGNFFWFPISAVAGSFLILFLAKNSHLRKKTIVWMGQNTLILMLPQRHFLSLYQCPGRKMGFLDTPFRFRADRLLGGLFDDSSELRRLHTPHLCFQ